MKKIVCFISAIIMVLALSSCGSGKDSNVSSNDVSSVVFNSLVPELAKQGKIDGVNFAIGAAIDQVVQFYNGGGSSENEQGSGTSSLNNSSAADSADEASSENMAVPDLNEEVVYDLTIRGLDTNDRIIKMYSYDTRYFYYNASPDSGIAYIAYFADNFGYMIGHSTYTDVKASIEAQPVNDIIAKEDDMFFMVQPLEGTKLLSYQYGDYVLSFFFDNNNKLMSTTIYNKHVWTE